MSNADSELWGLVEKWRKNKDDPSNIHWQQLAYGDCADELESILAAPQDQPIDADDNAGYIEHCADLLNKHGCRITGTTLRAIATVHRDLATQAPQAAPAGMVLVPRETLRWWRELVDANPADIAPRIDWYLDPKPAAQVAVPANHAACCANGGGSVASCDCVKRDHVRIPSPAFEEWFGSIWAGSDNIPVPEWQSVGWNEYVAQRGLALGAWEAATRCAAPAVVVDGAMVNRAEEARVESLNASASYGSSGVVERHLQAMRDAIAAALGQGKV